LLHNNALLLQLASSHKVQAIAGGAIGTSLDNSCELPQFITVEDGAPICCHACPSINAIGPAPLRGGLKNINRGTMLICIANAPSLLQRHSNPPNSNGAPATIFALMFGSLRLLLVSQFWCNILFPLNLLKHSQQPKQESFDKGHCCAALLLLSYLGGPDPTHYMSRPKHLHK
jgi:hypothetical protein